MAALTMVKIAVVAVDSSRASHQERGYREEGDCGKLRHCLDIFQSEAVEKKQGYSCVVVLMDIRTV